MLQLDAGIFARFSALIGQLYMAVKCNRGIPGQSLHVIEVEIPGVERYCTSLGLLSSSKQLYRIKKNIQYYRQGDMDDGQLASALLELCNRMSDELSSRVVYVMKDGKASYASAFDPADNGSITDIAKEWADALAAFPSIHYEVTEAYKCLAFARSTDAVFHLMRILEKGLAALAGRFGIDSDHANWQKIIERIEKAVREMASAQDRAPDWREQQEFYSQCASHFMLLKDAWRNYTAHGRGKFTEDEAELILKGVYGLMHRLSKRLHE